MLLMDIVLDILFAISAIDLIKIWLLRLLLDEQTLIGTTIRLVTLSECLLLSWSVATGTITMGLDAWVHAVPENILATSQEVDVILHASDDDGGGDCGILKGHIKSKVEKIEVYYWRKHHILHEWMGRLYDSKGGTDPQFNCNNVRLNSEDLDELEKDVLAGNLDDEDQDDDMLFIVKAREYIKNGYALFYDSWW